MIILSLSKIRDIKIKTQRPLEGNIKHLTIRRTPTQKWFVLIPTNVETYQLLEHSDKSVISMSEFSLPTIQFQGKNM